MTIDLAICASCSGHGFAGRIQLEYSEAVAFVWMLSRLTPVATRAMAGDDDEARRMDASVAKIQNVVEDLMLSMTGQALVPGNDERFPLDVFGADSPNASGC